MKKTLLTNLTYIAFGLVLATLASYAHASWGTLGNSYTAPTGSFPTNNTLFPITVGTSDQIKEGGLSLGGPFIAAANAQIDGSAIFHGALRGGSPIDTASFQTVSFGASGAATHVAITGGMANTKYKIYNVPLANASDGAVCANETGTLVLCDVDSTAPFIPKDPTSPTPPPLVTTGTVDMYIDAGQQQHGSTVSIYNTRTGENYTIDMNPGETTGYATAITVPVGTYGISGYDIYCGEWDSRYVTTNIGYIGEGDHYTIKFSCK